MDKEDFYFGKTIVRTEWWLEDYWLPTAAWARLRVLSDGCADVSFEPGGTLYGFTSADHADYFLTDEEYVCFDGLEATDELAYGIRVAALAPPQWLDSPDQAFTFLGAY